MGQRGPDRARLRDRGVRRRAPTSRSAGSRPLPRGPALHPDPRGRLHSSNGGGRLTFGADCRPGDELVEIARDTDLLIVEATLPRPERTGVRGHLTPGEAGEHARLAGAKRVVLTHISDELDAEWARGEAAQASAARSRSPARAPPTRSRPGRAAGIGSSSLLAWPVSATMFVNFDRMRPRDGRAARRRWAPARSAAARQRLLAPGRRLLLRRRAAARRSSRPTSPGSTSTPSTSRSPAATLVISGERPVQETEGRAYQQVEIPSGPLPPRGRARRRRRRRAGARPPTRTECCGSSCRCAAAETRARSRSSASRRPTDERPTELEAAVEAEARRARGRRDPDELDEAIRAERAAARRAAGPAAARDGHLPRHADPARGRPGALDQARRRRPLRQPDAGHGRLHATPSSTSPAPTTSTTSASPASSRGC